MAQSINLSVTPEEAADDAMLRKSILSILSGNDRRFESYTILRRSIDARNKNIRINLQINLHFKGDELLPEASPIVFQNVKSETRVLIVGAGPAGLFAALQLLQAGIKPVIIERGKPVRERRRDLALLNRNHEVNPDSNYCFGEGGAGTYSDGKLYTRSTKRGDVASVLKLLVQFGAGQEIMIDAHPHIGTNKLPQIIENMREAILNCGGEVHFNTRLKDLIITKGALRGVVIYSTELDRETELFADHLILATGHSARDIFQLLHSKNIQMELKPFAMGVRVEHPQEVIDRAQYHCLSEEERMRKRKWLPAASYSFVHQSAGRGVYSFCMCPGGIIAPCATAHGEVVVNGWSPSRRNNPFANSGVVVAVESEDLKPYQHLGNLAGLAYQKELEVMAFEAGGKNLAAPAQRLIDFVTGKISTSLPVSSYRPGILSAPLHELLPASIAQRLQDGLAAFGKKMKGYYTNEAVLHGVESRTSSPIRIPRDKLTFQHPEVKGLYPVGEGAGYAGGIVSAAIDGQNAAAQIALTIGNS